MSNQKSKIRLQSPTGIHDILENEQLYFDKVIKVVKQSALAYNFSKITTPILEYVEIFEKSTGATSDIVEKEMYVLKTKGGDDLCLRPEFTPGVVRAYLQHGMSSLPKPVKLYSIGPLFRHEKPQSGRYRQFHQFNFEIFGVNDPIVDAQTIQMFYNILNDLKIKDLCVHVNSIGCSECRPNYRKALLRYLKSKEKFLSSDSQKRMKKNPLRILDSKDPKDIEIVQNAPQVVDFLCEECHGHLKNVLEYLDEINLPYFLNSRLVRGLDYYTRTVFEIVQKNKDGVISSALIGGGRYDNLIKNMGGPETPAFGGAGGIERIILTIKDQNKGQELSNKETKFEVFLAPLGESAKKKALSLFEELRKEKITVAESFSKDSLKVQLGMASKLGSQYALILGHREVLDNKIIIRDMANQKQKEVDLDKIVKELKKLLKK
ncbi:MAG TPA: histidine--tRNA ligase [Candidatus Pacearchaeota archaeon]|mgnify:CR=1 FL=1|nr:histidine--tRNA ligase [Candidatus Parcubacteria bacterium]HNZ83882.1 histidine--tRNA ligase [Candidatus Pacearchaeota archaeon]HOU45558.1 histidine--tRNA ligase [Candidatus Pacearchaeota archaeon]HPM08421.1 histidine--tRNA ligase [Candidatus Pacearchaeota archaeon]HQI74285.1 histidine--tRNA ligase [Candidatus Pacearchaeota archaeon]